MGPGPYPASRIGAGRTIASARVVLACSSLFAIWIDPAEPQRYAQLTYALHVIYVTYAVLLAGLVWHSRSVDPAPLVTHGVDIAAFSVFQYLTLGPSSPFFVYFVFSLFCGAIRWGWKGALWAASIVMVAFLIMTASMSRTLGPTEFELNRAIVRIVYLVVVAWLLVYLGLYEQRLRHDIERLARWPSADGGDLARAAGRIVQHAAEIIGALRAVVVWEAGEEPRPRLASWSPAEFAVSARGPEDLAGIVPAGLERAAFVCSGPVAVGTRVPVTRSSSAGLASADMIVPPMLQSMDNTNGLASAPFETERVSGRVFFSGLGTPTAEILPLTEIVAREIGASLDQVHVTQQLTEIAASEERIRVARDLHDGVLQALTGIRLEMRSVGTTLDGSDATARDRLFAIERALAIEQRELRMFIDELGPQRIAIKPGTLAARLEALRQRIASAWKAPVTIRVTPEEPELPDAIAEAVPMMVHEAVVNALKHADPSRVSVTVDSSPSSVRIVVADDGHGFPFHGRYDHDALARMPGRPRSLLDRVASLGGRMAIDSSASGSRVEMLVSL